MQMTRRELALFLLLAAAGCSTTRQAFSPPERASDNPPDEAGTIIPVGVTLPPARQAATAAAVPISEPGPTGYLCEPSFSLDHLLRLPARAYVPQPGDIFLATDQRFVARWGHVIGHSGAPHHSGIVFALPDGRLALLEGGPYGSRFVKVLDLPYQLQAYSAEKRVWIRPPAVPLTPEQSRRLTAFVLAADGGHFANLRLWSQGHPLLRAKGPLRTRLFGRPYAANFVPENPEEGMRRRYFCSELVVEACVAAQLLPADTTRPTSMYPRELFFGTSRIPYIRDNLDMSAWAPPSRWTAAPGVGPVLRRYPFVEGDDDSIRRGP
jgi:hypothetical protein